MFLKTFIPFFLLLFLGTSEPEVDKAAAKEAFALLNNIRTKPKLYAAEIGTFLSKQRPMRALTWNDTLAKVAEEKAMDMAKNGYFDLVNKKGYGINYLIDKAGYKLNKDWLKHKRDNFFESIALGYTGPHEAIKKLLNENSDSQIGVSNRMLSQDKFHMKDTDIGIGFVRAETSKGEITYMSIIIARHN